MLTLEVPVKETPLLRYEKYHNRLVTFQKRAEIILLLSEQPYLQLGGIPCQQIASIVDVDRDTVSNIIRLYNWAAFRTLGFNGLMAVEFKGQKVL